jgi:hypothetical protein
MFLIACQKTNKQSGVASVEFALVALFIFFPLLLGIIEFGRSMYIWNTAQEITRRAAREATITDFSDTSAMRLVRQNAIFRATSGSLPAAAEITDESVAISFRSLDLKIVDPSTTCPLKNISTCLTDPANASCIRFVQASLCQPGTGQTNECVPVKYSPMIGLFSRILNIDIPPSHVVMPVESLGFRPSAPEC